MLVLSRKETQTIVIDDDIELTVVAIQGGRVKLGISAPKHVPIRRSELGTSSFATEAATNRPVTRSRTCQSNTESYSLTTTTSLRTCSADDC